MTGWMRQRGRFLAREEVNPTADMAIALADGDVPNLNGEAPPPDSEWVPQLYAKYGLADVARMTGLTVAQVRAILAETGTPLRRRGRPRKEVA